MSRKYLLDCSASGAKWADDVHRMSSAATPPVGVCNSLMSLAYIGEILKCVGQPEGSIVKAPDRLLMGL